MDKIDPTEHFLVHNLWQASICWLVEHMDHYIWYGLYFISLKLIAHKSLCNLLFLKSK